MHGGYFGECQCFEKVSIVKASMKVLVAEISEKKKQCFVNITERFFENLIFAFVNFLRFDISLDLTKNFLLIFVMNG